MKHTITTLASITLLASSHAAVISWGTATGITGISDISTNGTSLVAHNGGASDVTVNTVPFTAADLLAGSGVSVGQLAGGTTGDAGLDTLLNEVDFGGGGSLVSIDLGSFTSGNTIEIQIFFTDQRTGQQDRVMQFGSSTGGGTVDLEANPDNTTGSPFGSFATGTFVADGTDPDLTLAPQGFGNSHFSAIQIRDLGSAVPEPGSALLALLSLAGLVRRRRS
ncbi:hypothetical protein V2O64_10845 [Verrucomicrobiaceae bacterium 227]